MTQSKSRPVIFNSEMVNAILDDRKTQTRRVLKPQPPSNPLEQGGKRWGICDDKHYFCDIKCPYGKVGDKLLVKERIAHGGYEGSYLTYCADGKLSKHRYPDYWVRHVRSAYHMPRWASRITLEITNIRVERLQDISEEDAVAEGCYTNQQYYDLAGEENVWPCSVCNGFQVHSALGRNLGVTEVDCSYCEIASGRFKELWQSIKGSQSWSSNPFVWIIGFKKEANNA